jgi:primosomal protein N' (replication factor Y)
MKIIHAIPLGRGIFRDSLSYFSSKDINPGAIISVSVKNKQTPALVISSQSVDDVKAAIKDADYPIKKISGVKAKGIVRPEFVQAAIETANYFGYSLGPVLRSLLPKTILESSSSLDLGELKPTPSRTNHSFGGFVSALQDTDQERLSFYKSLIRETFAQNGSVFLCLPTAQDLEPVISRLERGISEYTFVFHSNLSRKELLDRWHRAINMTHPILIVATPSFLSFPRQDLRAIIIDREQTSSYKQIARPFIDWRIFAEILSKHYQTKLIIGDSSLRLETIYRAESKQIIDASPLKQRAPSRAAPLLIRGSSGRAIDEDLYRLTVTALERNERVLIIANRRGLAPLVVCNDCGNTVLCHRCESPIALHSADKSDRTEAPTVFLCHHCGAHRSPKEACETCGSWKLKELGTGTEGVIKELTEIFPNTITFRLDSDEARTPNQAKEIIAKYLATTGSILVATEMVLYYLKEPIENVLLVAIDSLLAIPDFRTSERLFSLLIRLRALATKNFAVQTRYESDPLFDFALRGNIIGFYREEIANRENYNYPPFKKLIKISREGNKETVRHDMKKLENLLKEYNPTVYPSFIGLEPNDYCLNLLLKLDPVKWPDKELSAVLKSLPISFIVNVEPSNIL